MQSRNPDMVTILGTAPPPQALLVDDRPDSATYSATRVCGLSWVFAVADCHFFPLSLCILFMAVSKSSFNHLEFIYEGYILLRLSLKLNSRQEKIFRSILCKRHHSYQGLWSHLPYCQLWGREVCTITNLAKSQSGLPDAWWYKCHFKPDLGGSFLVLGDGLDLMILHVVHIFLKLDQRIRSLISLWWCASSISYGGMECNSQVLQTWQKRFFFRKKLKRRMCPGKL